MRRAFPFSLWLPYPSTGLPVVLQACKIRGVQVCALLWSAGFWKRFVMRDTQSLCFFFEGSSVAFFVFAWLFGFFLIKLLKSKVMFTGKMLLEERPSSCQNVIVYFRYNDFWRQVNGLQGAAVGWVLLGWAHVASGFQSCFCLRFLESQTKHLAVPVPLILSCLKCRK